MKFFIDFEATQFSNRIISIGCIAENGNTFSTLVKPVNKAKVNDFITELTGISMEMLEDAPTADEAFAAFYDFVAMNNGETYPKYYCYGNSDKEFIKHTVKYMTNFKAITFALSLQNELINYSKDLQAYLKINRELSLRVAHGLITTEEHNQKHDALEDAVMLKEVFDKSNGITADKALAAAAKPSENTNRKPKAKAPDIFVNWPDATKDMYNADTLANETNWRVRSVDKATGATKYFPNIDIATLWVMKYRHCGSPKRANDIIKISSRIETVINNENKGYHGFMWTRKEENENV